MNNELALAVAAFPVGAQGAEGINENYYEFKKMKEENTRLRNEMHLMNAYIKSDQSKITDNEDLLKEVNIALSLASINERGINLGIQSKLLSTAIKDVKSIPAPYIHSLRTIKLYLERLGNYHSQMETVLNKNNFVIRSIRNAKIRILQLQEQVKYKELEKENNIEYYEFEKMVEELKEPHKKKLQKILVMRHILQQIILINPKWMKSKRYVNLLTEMKEYLTWESFENKFK